MTEYACICCERVCVCANGFSCVESIFAMTNYSISLYLTTFEPKSINIHFNACTHTQTYRTSEILHTDSNARYVIDVVLVTWLVFILSRQLLLLFFFSHFQNYLGKWNRTLEMFALMVDLYDKCDSSQMKSLVDSNFFFV